MHSIKTAYIYIYICEYVDFISNHTMFIILKALLFPQPQKCLKWTVKSTEKFLIIIKVSLHCSFFFFSSKLTFFVKTQPAFFNNCEHKRWWTKIVPISMCRVYFSTMRVNVTAKHLHKLKKGLSKVCGSSPLIPFPTGVMPEDGNVVWGYRETWQGAQMNPNTPLTCATGPCKKGVTAACWPFFQALFWKTSQ